MNETFGDMTRYVDRSDYVPEFAEDEIRKQKPQAYRLVIAIADGLSIPAHQYRAALPAQRCDA